MTRYWDTIRERILSKNGILSIGISDVIGSGISSIFWLYIASEIDPGEYGEIHYFLGIAAMAQMFSMFGNPTALTVYCAKKRKNPINSIFPFNYSNNYLKYNHNRNFF